MDEPRFDVEDVFDDDYLHFYAELLTDERTQREVELLWTLLALQPGMHVLDLACGHGRFANALAERGARVTGLDVTPLFLEAARRDAAERGVEAEYVHGDMRSLPWKERFDRIVCWFTSFGYFSDEENRLVLGEAREALKPGGRLAIEMNNGFELARRFLPSTVHERDGDLAVDVHEFDVLSGRTETDRIVVRGGRLRRMHFSVRLFTYAELRDWLQQGGFGEVAGYDHDGEALSAESQRMVVIATR